MSRRRKRLSISHPPPPLPAHDWKSNPVIVAGGSVAATTLLCIAVVTQIVIPTQTAKLEIAALKANNVSRGMQARLATAEKSNKELNRTNSLLSSQVESLGKQLLDARSGALLNPGNPYPTDLGIVRIGTPISEVRKRFLPSQIETDPDRPDLLRVTLHNSPFIEATYSFDKKDPQRKITHIAFMLDYKQKFADDFLSNKITHAIGTPIEQPQRGYYRWPDTSGLRIFLLDDIYMIMTPNFAPAVWPE